jgi:hypothetical protein
MGNRSPRAKQQHAERAKARKMVHARVGTDVFLAAQGFTCPLCDQSLDYDDCTIEHVWPIAFGVQHAGNILLAHRECNRLKHNSPPDERALEMLETVNQCLGFDGIEYECDISGSVIRVSPPVELPLAEFMMNVLRSLYVKLLVK